MVRAGLVATGFPEVAVIKKMTEAAAGTQGVAHFAIILDDGSKPPLCVFYDEGGGLVDFKSIHGA